MADSSLKERLLNSQKAFDGLLSLIPAKMYYGEDATDQWQRKKQTKAQAAEARRNKLDPDSALNRSAKEVMDEQARKKRKRDQMRIAGNDDDDWSEVEGIEAEQPRQGMKKKTAKEAKKKQKQDAEEAEVDEKERRKEEKKAARKERKAERQILREEEAEFNRRNIKGVNKIKLGKREDRPNTQSDATKEHTETGEQMDTDDPETSELPAHADETHNSESMASPTDTPQSPVFDTNGTPADSIGQAPSITTSVSSADQTSEKPKPKKIPADSAALRARLAARIQALRDARKADKEGKPIRTREELLESRRQKQAERKAHKKEQRQKAKQEEDRKREEALASARESPGGILSPNVDPEEQNNFAFGRVGFGDGSQLSHDLTHVLNRTPKKGPSDPKTALLKFENQKKRLESMGEEKRKDIEEKEAWLTARRRAEGEKIRDDEKMLKKAVKRKEVSKKKSSKEWSARKEGVAKGIKERQKKREENIRKRRDEKILGKAGKKKGAKKAKGRAGFEGSFMGKKR
ncbi:putative surfeit locus protein 6 protein [Rosellinia necatrix]|uniref:Putative surfeit locus protein 6 protein n=1 Tax=Rosellinia necatrix TaxID=77044 RepID=A0A1S7UPC3_ROSNE|nr:putative surfeit locus protein 6 protein [Rosellinia necatrix]